MTIPEQEAVDALKALVRAAVERVVVIGQPVEAFRGIAYYDTERDAIFTALDHRTRRRRFPLGWRARWFA